MLGFSDLICAKCGQPFACEVVDSHEITWTDDDDFTHVSLSERYLVTCKTDDLGLYSECQFPKDSSIYQARYQTFKRVADTLNYWAKAQQTTPERQGQP